MPNKPTKHSRGSALDNIPSIYKNRATALLMSYCLMFLCIGAGILYWPFLLKLGLSVPFLFWGKWNSTSFVWTVPQMRGVTIGWLLTLWGAIDGAIYFGLFAGYRYNLIELRKRWTFAYKWFFPTAKLWMPDELARPLHWAVGFTLFHLVAASATLLLVAAGTSYVAATYFRMSFQYSHQIEWLMFQSLFVWGIIAHPAFGLRIVPGMVDFICSHIHLHEDIQYARDNIALHAERERNERRSE